MSASPGARRAFTTADVLDGLCDSMNSYVSAIMQAVSEC
jgi:hypothetical protein